MNSHADVLSVDNQDSTNITGDDAGWGDGYNLIYRIDGLVYKTIVYESGASIIAEPAPTKEGYTFSGWSEIPGTMPAQDVEVIGSFSINSYQLVYKVDGAEFKTLTLDYGTEITPESAPTKEGYTFSGWSSIPETMPANDIEITGAFSINSYKLTYVVDGSEYKTYAVEFGSTITAEPAPTKEGFTFSGWSEIPETMPANDVEVTGTFGLNTYSLVYKIDGKIYKSFAIEFGAQINAEPAPTKEGY
ncbi:MAG: InlB B-repeat-containing protein, partial [Bacteroidaceae bacterium]|nr:InlB B-repeat-containing protein [Bacteroidaceae bacterium]